jgi:hypothetical protein
MAAFEWCFGIGIAFMCLVSIMAPGMLLKLFQSRQYFGLTKNFTVGALAYGLIFYVGYEIGTEVFALFG